MKEYEEALTDGEKLHVLAGVCPIHPEHELEQKGSYVWCPLSDEYIGSEEEGNDERVCPFFTTREWIKYQTGSDPWHFEIRAPKKS